MPQQSAFEYLRHGQTPFFRLPLADVRAAGPAAYAGADAVILGVPYDGGTTYQPGARLAPFHVRRVSALVQTWHRTHGLDVFARKRVVDGGNVVFPPFSAPAMREAVEGEVGAVLAAGAAAFVVGGDHGVALPAWRAAARKHGPLAIVHVDAHLDTSGPEVWGEVHHHGTPMRHALQEGVVAPGQLHQVGIRATWGHAEEGELARSHGAQLHAMEHLDARGIDAVTAQIKAAVGDRPLWITFDVDGIDPAFAPGTGTPVPGGMTSREAFALLRGLRGANVVGMDLVEIAPSLDHADLTCHLGAHLLFEGLALLP
jgi:agmatinase